MTKNNDFQEELEEVLEGKGEDEVAAQEEAEEEAFEKAEAKAAQQGRPESAEGGEGTSSQDITNEATPEAEASKSVEKMPKKAKKEGVAKSKKAHKRSKKYREKITGIDKEKLHTPDEAIELVKEASYAKFGGSVDLHIKIAKVKAKKGPGETFRTMVELPSGTGKTKKVVVLTEEIIEEIAKAKSAEADIYIATPDIMGKVGKIARILGTQGKMPNPKSGTVTSDVEKTKEALEGGRVELRADAGNVLHQSIGRLDWEDDKLKANYTAIIAVLPKTKIQTITLAPTMGPGVKIAFKK